MTAPRTPLTGSGFLHYARAGQMSDGYQRGDQIEAICGVPFIPSRAKLPVCQDCRAEFSAVNPSAAGNTGKRRRTIRSTGIAGTQGSNGGFGLA